MEGADSGEICTLLSTIGKDKKYKKIHINLELIDSD